MVLTKCGKCAIIGVCREGLAYYLECFGVSVFSVLLLKGRNDVPMQKKKRVFPPEGYLSVPRAAIELGCGLNSIYRWIAEGRLKVEKFRRYPASLEMGQAVKREDVLSLKQQFEDRLEEGYMTVPAAAKLLGCSETTLYRWIRQGTLLCKEFRGSPGSLKKARAVKRDDILQLKQQLTEEDQSS